MKRNIFTAASVVLVVLAAAVQAAAVPSICVDPDTSQVWTEGEVWVDISVNDEVLDLTGYDLVIDFDESVIEVVDVVEGSLPQTAASSFFFWTIDPDASNAIVINGAILGDTVDGPGVLVSILFRGLTEGDSPVDFVFHELRDLDNQPIAVEAVGGVVEVSDPPAIYLTPQLTEVYEGTIFPIDVAINRALTGLTGYDLVITLDADIVRFVDAVEGSLPPSGGADTYFFYALEGADSETLVINGAVLGEWIDGPGVLATINLIAHFQGTSDVSFASVDLRDLDNNGIDASSQDAVVIVLPGGSPAERTSWSSIKSLFR